MFLRGREIDRDDPPPWMQTPEMRDVMGILQNIAGSEENFVKRAGIDPDRSEQ